MPKERSGLRVRTNHRSEAPMHREAVTVFRSTFLRRAPGLAVLIALVALLAPAGAQAQGCANVNVKPTRGNLEVVRSAVLCLHNAERARHGLPKLRENPRLRRAADAPLLAHGRRATSSTTPRRAARRWSTASAAPATRAAPAAGRSARTSPGARAGSRPRRRSSAAWMKLVGSPREHPPALVPRDRDRHRDRPSRAPLRVAVGRHVHHRLRLPPIEQGLRWSPGGGGRC